jgi:hypothetical protein
MMNTTTSTLESVFIVPEIETKEASEFVKLYICMYYMTEERLQDNSKVSRDTFVLACGVIVNEAAPAHIAAAIQANSRGWRTGPIQRSAD